MVVGLKFSECGKTNQGSFFGMTLEWTMMIDLMSARITILYQLAPSHDSEQVFKIEVFNAHQMWFGPSKYTSLKTTLQNATPS